MHGWIPNASAHRASPFTAYAEVHTVGAMSDGIRGDRVKEQREARGWTQQDLARESGIAQSTLSRIESGRSRGSYAATARTLARLFSCTEAYLTGDDSAPGPELHVVTDGEAAPTQGARPGADDVVAEVLATSDVPEAFVRMVLDSGSMQRLNIPLTPAALEAMAKVVQRHAQRRRR